MPYRFCYSQIFWRPSVNEAPFSQMTLACVNLTQTIQHPRDAPASAFPVSGLQEGTTTPVLLCGLWGPSSVPLVCKVNTLLTELSPWSLNF